jgi:SAM dependent carboxyl methyltransferase
MEGSGFYNRNSAMQAAGIAQLLPLWEMACRNVEIGLETPLIVDYGSSQGRNSMAPVRIAIEELRRRTGTDSPIEVIHTDLPTNDFSSLFKALQEEPDSYMAGLSDIFPAAIGRSYFDPLLPPGRVHLGWNTFTLQWMSTSPADAPDGIVAGESQSAEVSTAVRTQLDIDWRRFLEMRSLEMRAGAKILSAFTCRTSEGTGWEWLYGELWSAVLDLERASLLKQEERCHIAIPIGYRTLEDINAPFSTSGRFAGLEIERIEFFRIPDPFWDDFQRTGDAAELGRRQADSTRAWAGPSITGRIGLNRDRAGLVDDLFARFAARVSAAPRKHEPHLAAVLLTKRH